MKILSIGLLIGLVAAGPEVRTAVPDCATLNELLTGCLVDQGRWTGVVNSRIGIGKDPFIPDGQEWRSALHAANLQAPCEKKVFRDNAVAIEKWAKELIDRADVRVFDADMGMLDVAEDGEHTTILFRGLGVRTILPSDSMTSRERAALIIERHVLPALKAHHDAISESGASRLGVAIVYGVSEDYGTGETVAVVADLDDCMAYSNNAITQDDFMRRSQVFTSVAGRRDFSRIELTLK